MDPSATEPWRRASLRPPSRFGPCLTPPGAVHALRAWAAGFGVKVHDRARLEDLHLASWASDGSVADVYVEVSFAEEAGLRSCATSLLYLWQFGARA